MMEKRKILILCDTYLPGYKAGGPIRSLTNLIQNFASYYDFHVVTGDRDLGDQRSYENIEVECFQDVGSAKVWYGERHKINTRKLQDLICADNYAFIYLNSFFSLQFSIMPLWLRRFKRIPKVPFILAPRGELSQGALAQKSIKKRLFLVASKVLGLHKGMIWQASSALEKKDIMSFVGADQHIMIAPDLPGCPENFSLPEKPYKERGKLRMVFLSRICKMKNLKFVLSWLKDITGEIEFDIYGPPEDEEYCQECREISSVLPVNIKVSYQGAVRQEKVHEILSQYHLFVLPTLGENYGHVIPEALLAGCPVLISNHTPWQNLDENGVGWSYPLDDPGQFIKALGEVLEMDNSQFLKVSAKAYNYSRAIVSNQQHLDSNKQLLERAIALGSGG